MRILRRSLLAILVVLAACTSAVPSGGRTGPRAGPTGASPSVSPLPHLPSLKHVWLFVMENHSYGEIIGKSSAPYINRLSLTYGLATRFFARRHPSLPNYLSMIAGSAIGCESDTCVPGYGGATLAGQLAAAHLSWAGYFEDLPQAGYTGPDAGGYVRHHNPFVYFTEVTSSAPMRNSIRPLTDFAGSLKAPPAFSMIVPNDDHNMHSGTVKAGDDWLKAYVAPVLASAAFKDGGLILITWDEANMSDTSGCCASYMRGGHVPTIVIATGGKRGFQSTVDHTTFSICSTIEDGFHLGHVRKAGSAAGPSMGEFWAT